MPYYIANQLIKKMIATAIKIDGAKILLMGLSFKENCSDIRNTKVYELYRELQEFGCLVELYDPVITAEHAEVEYKISMTHKPKTNNYDAIVLSVAHAEFLKMGISNIRRFGKKKHILYDLKYLFPENQSDLRL